MSDRWSSSDRRSELPEDWSSRVKAVKRRARGQCEHKLPSGHRCPRPGRDVDHKRDPADHTLGSLQLLCGHHHDQKTQREAAIARAARQPQRRPTPIPEPHPGVIRT